MRNKNKALLWASLLVFCALALTGPMSAEAAGKVRFKVKLKVGSGLSYSGRLLIFMTKKSDPVTDISPDFTDPEAVYVSGTEVSNLDGEKIIEIDPDREAFPRKFSEAPDGEYQVMALLDQNHSYTYDGQGAGDLRSEVVKVSLPSEEVELTLSMLALTRRPEVPENVRLVEFESPMLSKFWGRPVKMEASVVLPPGYDQSKPQKYPTVYSIHGYGGDHLKPLRGAPDLIKKMQEGSRPEMIYVYLNAHCPLGHHVFADSVNNGPWGTALVKEFIPHLEKEFRMDARPVGRFLTGHSSGGWATLWVMISHPDFFGGTWSTSPDPVDFRNFTGPDLTADPLGNLYRNPDGKEYNLVRFGGRELMSIRQYAEQEMVLGHYGGQFASFNAVFSPKGPDGRPMSLADPETGRIDPEVARAWEKYDISRVLRDNWKTLGPKLKGKLHIIVGTADTFHLDEAVRLLDGELKKLGSDARIEYLEGKTHFDLYQDGLGDRIAAEMYRVARPKAKAAGK